MGSLRKQLKRVTKSSLFWCGVSATAGVLLAFYLMPVELAALSITVLFFHELAHFLMALAVGAKPSWPIFIPLGLFIVAWTKVRHLDVRFVPAVALSGPVVGAMLSILAIFLGWACGNPLLVVGGILSLLFEIFSGTLGADGAQARKWYKANKVSV